MAKLGQCGADGVGFQGKVDVLTADFLRSLRSGGLREFHVWTIDSIADAKRFQTLGAMGITTNKPRSIRQGLQ